MVPRRRKISKNRDHTTSKVHIQARRKMDNKKKFTDSQIAAWIWYQEKNVHEQILIYKVHIYWGESLQLSPFLNEIIAKLEWTEISSQERTERAESLCWFSIQIIQGITVRFGTVSAGAIRFMSIRNKYRRTLVNPNFCSADTWSWFILYTRSSPLARQLL